MRVSFAVFCLAVLTACGEKPPAAPAAQPEPPAADAAPAEPAPRAAIETMPIADIAAKMVGKFRSVDDPKAMLTISADGVWLEDYETTSPIHSTMTWRLFKGSDGPANAGVNFTPASYYLEVKAPSDTFFYEMAGVDETGFDMFYTARGNHLAYERIK
jgi:hypothetical protein